jgi:hypothetical protein
MLRRNSSGKNALLFLLVFAFGILVLVPIVQRAYADSAPVSSTVSLQYFTLQVQYSPVVLPGTNTEFHVQAIAKSAVNLNSLTAYIYYVDGTTLHQVTSATIVGTQTLASGNTFTKDLQVTIPQGMPRTSLFATFTESAQFSYVSSYSYSYYPYYWYNCGSYNYNNMGNCYYYPDYNSYSSNPQYSYLTVSDTGISPLSYVNATTPEYTSLLSQYQTQQQQLSQLQSQNQNLQQQINQQNQQNSQLQAQLQQLQQSLQNAQGTISQTNSDNSNLNSQLHAANTTNRHLTYLVIVFGIIAVLAIALGQRGGRPKKTQSVNPYAANYAPPQTEQRPAQ